MPSSYVVYIKRHKLYIEQFDHNNNYVKKLLGSAIYVTDITKIFETKVINLYLEFLYGGKWDTITIPRNHLQDRELLDYAKFGLNVNRGNIKYVVESLMQQEQKLKPSIVHEGIGFDVYENPDTGKVKKIFKAHQCIGMKSNYIGAYKIQPVGTLKEFQKFLHQDVYNTPLELSVVVGLAGVLIGFIGEDVQCPNIVTNIWGDSSTGKSSFATLAVSMGSKPDEGSNSLFRDFNGTDNALMGSLVGNYGYPICFDEANKYQGKNFAYLIYNMEGGTQKQRLTREGNMQSRGTYHTSIITTAEKPINNGNSSQNAGQGVRILEFGNIPWTVDADHSERVKSFAMNNYGGAVIHLAHYVMKLGRANVLKMYKENREDYLTKSKVSNEFTHRMSIKFAILLTTLQLANQAMKLELSYDLIMDMLVTNEESTSDSRDIGKKAYQYLVQMSNEHPDKFSITPIRGLIIDAKGETWGLQDPKRNVFTCNDKNYRTVVWFSEEKFKQLLEKGKFESMEVVLKRLKQAGYLDAPASKEDSRYYRKRKISNLGSKVKVYGIRLFDDPSVDSKAELEDQIIKLDNLKKMHFDDRE